MSSAPLIPAAKFGGHPRTTDMREICNAIYYHLKTGCQWDMLPGDFPPSSTVYSYYRKWQKRGIWEQMNHTLRDQVRQKIGKLTQPTAIARLEGICRCCCTAWRLPYDSNVIYLYL